MGTSSWRAARRARERSAERDGVQGCAGAARTQRACGARGRREARRAAWTRPVLPRWRASQGGGRPARVPGPPRGLTIGAAGARLAEHVGHRLLAGARRRQEAHGQEVRRGGVGEHHAFRHLRRKRRKSASAGARRKPRAAPPAPPHARAALAPRPASQSGTAGASRTCQRPTPALGARRDGWTAEAAAPAAAPRQMAAWLSPCARHMPRPQRKRSEGTGMARPNFPPLRFLCGVWRSAPSARPLRRVSPRGAAPRALACAPLALTTPCVPSVLRRRPPARPRRPPSPPPACRSCCRCAPRALPACGPRMAPR